MMSSCTLRFGARYTSTYNPSIHHIGLREPQSLIRMDPEVLEGSDIVII